MCWSAHYHAPARPKDLGNPQSRPAHGDTPTGVVPADYGEASNAQNRVLLVGFCAGRA